MKTASPLTAHVSIVRRLVLRFRHWRQRHDTDYPTYSCLVQSNPAGNKHWRKMVLRAITPCELLKALTSANRRYMIEVKEHPYLEGMLSVGIFPIANTPFTYPPPRDRPTAGSLAVYFDLTNHELKHTAPVSALAIIDATGSGFRRPPRHFNIASSYS